MRCLCIDRGLECTKQFRGRRVGGKELKTGAELSVGGRQQFLRFNPGGAYT
jgi:hypothetical protein